MADGDANAHHLHDLNHSQTFRWQGPWLLRLNPPRTNGPTLADSCRDRSSGPSLLFDVAGMGLERSMVALGLPYCADEWLARVQGYSAL